MSAFESIMWRADRISPSPMVIVEQLAGAPDWGRLIGVHEWAVRTYPRLRQQVVEAPLGLGAPCWSEDPYFDLGAHLRRMAAPRGTGWSHLMAEAARWALTPFDRARPPWEALLYEGLPDGRAAYLIKMHHALTDGLGAAQLLERMHCRSAGYAGTGAGTTGPDGGPPPPVVPAARTSGMGAMAGQLRHDVAAVPGTLAAVGTGAVEALRDPAAWLMSATRYGKSLRRTLTPPDAPGSTLLAGRGPAWSFAALDVPLAELRAAAKVAGATLNDAYLAALLGGYRLYHAELGAELEAVPMGVPVSLRRPGDPGGGNRFVGVRFAGPAGVVDPLARIRAVRELILSARAEPAIDTVGLMSPALGRLPGALVARLIAPMTAGNDLQASFVPGARTDRYLAGTRVERIYPYAPLPGCPAMITLVTHGTVGCVGVNFDPVAITSPEIFMSCLRDGFLEVLGLQARRAEVVARI
jgi:WS/DGAT/MGAT family acyltransferase